MFWLRLLMQRLSRPEQKRKETALKLRNAGKLLCLSLALFNGCRTDQPPKIDICIGDGLGGSDCILKSGVTVYRLPSEMRNYWCTTQSDMAAWSSWAYGADVVIIQGEMEKTRLKINP